MTHKHVTRIRQTLWRETRSSQNTRDTQKDVIFTRIWATFYGGKMRLTVNTKKASNTRSSIVEFYQLLDLVIYGVVYRSLVILVIYDAII